MPNGKRARAGKSRGPEPPRTCISISRALTEFVKHSADGITFNPKPLSRLKAIEGSINLPGKQLKSFAFKQAMDRYGPTEGHVSG